MAYNVNENPFLNGVHTTGNNAANTASNNNNNHSNNKVMTNNSNNQVVNFDNMEDVFNTLTQYGSKWELLEQRKFNERECSRVERTEVVASKYGMSVCFFMVGGKTMYIPTDKQSPLNIGDTPDMADLILKKIKNVGEANIPLGEIKMRVTIEDSSKDVNSEPTSFEDPFGLNK